MVAPRVGAVIIGFGLVLLLFGGVGYGVCSSAASGVSGAPFPTPGCSPILIPLFIGLVLLIAGVAVLVAAHRTYTYIPPTTDPAIPPPLIRPIVIQKTVEHDVVKIRCRYCGTLSDATQSTCPSCGAPL